MAVPCWRPISSSNTESLAMKALPLVLLFSSAALLASLKVSTAQAASFDCSKAGSANEKTICHDPQLSALDDQLGQTFRLARQAAPDVRAFRAASDAQWLWREHHCHDRDCLLAWYQRRQAELQAQTVPVTASVTAPALAALAPAAPTPPVAPTLQLGLSDHQIEGVAPEGASPWPHYTRAERGQYFYRDPQASDTQPLVAVRYYGVENGQYILEAVRGSTVLRYTCSADCHYISQLALPGDVEKDTVIVHNERGSLPALIVSDALNGLLAPSLSR
ncbi:lipoprotein [Herbaspirillum rubrisubalbicans]|nr:lipoprotein [Herbaspirillum rubrisubalbicans]